MPPPLAQGVGRQGEAGAQRGGNNLINDLYRLRNAHGPRTLWAPYPADSQVWGGAKKDQEPIPIRYSSTSMEKEKAKIRLDFIQKNGVVPPEDVVGLVFDQRAEDEQRRYDAWVMSMVDMQQPAWQERMKKLDPDVLARMLFNWEQDALSALWLRNDQKAWPEGVEGTRRKWAISQGMIATNDQMRHDIVEADIKGKNYYSKIKQSLYASYICNDKGAEYDDQKWRDFAARATIALDAYESVAGLNIQNPGSAGGAFGFGVTGKPGQPYTQALDPSGKPYMNFAAGVPKAGSLYTDENYLANIMLPSRDPDKMMSKFDPNAIPSNSQKAMDWYKWMGANQAGLRVASWPPTPPIINPPKVPKP